MGQIAAPSTCRAPLQMSPVPPVSPSPNLLGKGRSEGDFSGLFSVKQRVPSRLPSQCPAGSGSTPLAGHLPSETKCPDPTDPPANLFPPRTFFELSPIKQRVPSHSCPLARYSSPACPVPMCPVPVLVQGPWSKVQSQDCDPLTFSTLDPELPRVPSRDQQWVTNFVGHLDRKKLWPNPP
jgi:hypothetical protein